MGVMNYLVNLLVNPRLETLNMMLILLMSLISDPLYCGRELSLLPLVMALPQKLIIGYANWNQCDDSMIESIRNGVNVLMWFSIDLTWRDEKATIGRGPDLSCVAKIYKKIIDLDLEVVHMITIGGWNAPHPSTDCTAKEMYQTWKDWNENITNFPGFQGFDWDIEGNDDLASPSNEFTKQGLDLMGEMSQLAKKDGYIVSMAPAESYLNCFTSDFDRKLNHSYPEWSPIVPHFTYHSHNSYAYILSKYGVSVCNDLEVDTFDFIMVQFYEGFSRMLYYTKRETFSPASYLESALPNYYNGWIVNYEQDPIVNLPSQLVRIKPSQMIIGLANGWANNEKFLFLDQKELQEIGVVLKRKGIEPRGYGFWNLQDEGGIVNGEPFWLAKVLKDVLN
jgi:chitinase